MISSKYQGSLFNWDHQSLQNSEYPKIKILNIYSIGTTIESTNERLSLF
jgi:hypothetical protein